MEYHSAIKKKGTMPFAATWMGLEMIILSEVNQTGRQVSWYYLHVKSKKNVHKGTYLQAETDSQTWKTNFIVTKEELPNVVEG